MADSMDMPDDVRRIFQLNDRRARPFEDIERVLQGEFGDLEAVFAIRADPEPLGTASLAQAHAARLLDGTPVVIKVLHDGVEHSVYWSQSSKIHSFAGRVLKRSKEEIDLIFDEIHARLKEELDYENERKNLERFPTFFADSWSRTQTHDRSMYKKDFGHGVGGNATGRFYGKVRKRRNKEREICWQQHFMKWLMFVVTCRSTQEILFGLDGSLSLLILVVKYFDDRLIDYGLMGNTLLMEKEESIVTAQKLEPRW